MEALRSEDRRRRWLRRLFPRGPIAGSRDAAGSWRQQVSRSQPPFLIVPGVFSREECERLVSLGRQGDLVPARTWEDGRYGVNPSSRRAVSSVIPRAALTTWIYRRMDVVFFGAARYWGLDARDTMEELKYLAYGEADHFAQWHADAGDGDTSRRKLSMSVELCSSAEYDGGDLQVFPTVEGHVAGESRAAGTAVVFPSHRYHRVTPVTRGTRHVLVNWMSGPPLR